MKLNRKHHNDIQSQTLFLGLKRIEIYKYKTYTLLILLLIKFLSSDLYSANGKGKT